MVNEMLKKNPNDTLIRKNMDVTFALRRDEVVKYEPDISQMVQRWPALFTESQVYLEFNRVTSRNLKEEFFSVLDSLCPSFMDIFKRKTGGRMGKQLADLLQQTTSTEPTVMRCLILRGLPIILGDDASIFFKSSLNDSMDIPVGIICYEDTSAENAASPASPESSALPKLNPTRVGIILEGSVVMDTLTNLPQAMCLLFGFTYALHLQYPKCLKNTFIFIQQVMLNLGRSELPPKVQKLKNDLAV